jgi:hypothetical protein
MSIADIFAAATAAGDAEVRRQGIGFIDGSIPGYALLLGDDAAAAPVLVEELTGKSIAVFVASDALVDALRGGAATFGGWFWSTHPARINLSLAFDGGLQRVAHSVEVTSQPKFYAFNVDLPADISRIHLVVIANNASVDADSNIVYCDALVMAAGTYPVEAAPEFDDLTGEGGIWGEAAFVNLLRNPSAEKAWLRVAPWFEKLRRRHHWAAHLDMSTLLSAVMDWNYTAKLYRISTSNILETFWARFGWGHVTLQSDWWYWLLKRITFLGMAGSIFVFWYSRNKPSAWKLSVGWLLITILLVWGGVLVRGFVTLLLPKIFIPAARYGYPVIIPTMFFLLIGWGWLLERGRKYVPALTWLFFLVLDITSVITILKFYAVR